MFEKTQVGLLDDTKSDSCNIGNANLNMVLLETFSGIVPQNHVHDL